MKEIFVYVLVVLTLVDGQVVSQGRCPKVNLVKNFDMTRYAGAWNEMYRYENSRQQGLDCGYETHKYKNDSLEVYHTDMLNDKIFAIPGTLTFDNDANGEAKLIFVARDDSFKMPYLVLNTDYKRHALVYSCINLENENKQVFSWILGRNESLSVTSVIDMDPDVKAAELIWHNYRVTDLSEKTCY